MIYNYDPILGLQYYTVTHSFEDIKDYPEPINFEDMLKIAKEIGIVPIDIQRESTEKFYIYSNLFAL